MERLIVPNQCSVCGAKFVGRTDLGERDDGYSEMWTCEKGHKMRVDFGIVNIIVTGEDESPQQASITQVAQTIVGEEAEKQAVKTGTLQISIKGRVAEKTEDEAK